jgi:hypothetical protein
MKVLTPQQRIYQAKFLLEILPLVKDIMPIVYMREEFSCISLRILKILEKKMMSKDFLESLGNPENLIREQHRLLDEYKVPKDYAFESLDLLNKKVNSFDKKINK